MEEIKLVIVLQKFKLSLLEITSFLWGQGKLPLTGMLVTKLEEMDGNENAFEIGGQ